MCVLCKRWGPRPCIALLLFVCICPAVYPSSVCLVIPSCLYPHPPSPSLLSPLSMCMYDVTPREGRSPERVLCAGGGCKASAPPSPTLPPSLTHSPSLPLFLPPLSLSPSSWQSALFNGRPPCPVTLRRRRYFLADAPDVLFVPLSSLRRRAPGFPRSRPCDALRRHTSLRRWRRRSAGSREGGEGGEVLHLSLYPLDR